MKQFASCMELRTPDPCPPVLRTASRPVSSYPSTPRWNSTRPGRLRSREVHFTRNRTGAAAGSPIIRRRAGWTNW